MSTPDPFVVPTDDSSITLSHSRSERSNKGSHQSVRYIDEVFLAHVTSHHPSSAVVNLVYKAELESDFDNGKINCTDPRAYAVKFKMYDEDKPSYNMAMTEKPSVEYQQTMVKAIRQLLTQTRGVVFQGPLFNQKENLFFQGHGHSN